MIRPRAVEIANTIRLERSRFPGAYLLVEGRDDRLFFERSVDGVRCRIVVADGKANVTHTIELLESTRTDGILGIVDSDFDHLLGAARYSANVVATSVHDIEGVLFHSSALEAVLTEFGSRAKLGVLAQSPRDFLLEAARTIGAVRLHSLRDGLNLSFDGLKIARFVDPARLAVDFDGLVQILESKTGQGRIDRAQLKASVERVLAEGHASEHLCTGPDSVGLLSLGLRSVFGTMGSAAPDSDRLRSALRLAYDSTDFERSALRAAIVAWETRNPSFKVLVVP